MTLTEAFAAAPEKPRSRFRFATGRAADGSVYLAFTRSPEVRIVRLPAGTPVAAVPPGTDWDPIPLTPE
jgi:hypothetical protein